ncbi:MAG: DNA recombination protein RmuC [Gammaproteobacteria bacterium]|jgi:DNA recombination protein RmuC|nr:DNA recombination protein RmuC [Gammaproteobacteria bacterium]
MINDDLLISAGLSALALLMGVLALLSRKRQSSLQQQLTESQSAQLQAAHQVHVLELEQATLKTSQQATVERNDELRQELSGLNKTLEQLRQDKHQAEKEGEALRVELQELQKDQKDKSQRLRQAAEALEDKSSRITQLENDQAIAKERESSHAREVANFLKQKEELTQHFKVLSTEILQANTRSLQESSKLTLSAVINPFQQSIDGFKKEVQDIHHRESTQRGELKKELASLKELNQKITTEAHELSTALRGQKKLQGNWGELVLENVLDRSGLVLGQDYKREVSFTTETGRQRPDAVVYLPQKKHLIIDAKVSLNAYTRYINSEDKVARKVALDEHVRAVGDRINELADRDYYKLPGLNSPEMVFMFIPIESAFVEALKADETLFQKAIENNVLVATPTTLLTSLNIVRQLWRYEDQNKHTAALAKQAERVFKKLNAFLNNFEEVKKGLDKAAEAYRKAEGQLVSGRGNLVKQVGEFKNLAPAIKAELPSYFTEKSDLEIDYTTTDQAPPTNGDDP